jgi:Nitrile hydratase, alpha chain
MPEQTSRREFELQLIEKAWKDEAFRQALRSDPRGAVERVLGGKLPAGVQVKLVEETADTFYLVLPAIPDRASSGQLNDQQLGAVAGGGWTDAGDYPSSGCGTCVPQASCGSCVAGCP